MLVRPKLFLDTNVCINVASGRIPPREWSRVQRHINKRYRYCISFITVKELFSKLARGADDYIDKNKAPLRVLYGLAKRRFLPYPSVFTLRTVLNMQSAARVADTHSLPEEVALEDELNAVLDAPGKAQLKAGFVMRKKEKTLFRTFDLDDFDVHENGPQNEHADLLQGMREGSIDKPDPLKVAAWMLHQHDLPPYPEQCERLAASLDAAYRFGYSLSQMTKDPAYDFHRHASDWGDTLQLMYLCDESMHFLTSDRDFRIRTKGSAQASRILLYPDFVRDLP